MSDSNPHPDIRFLRDGYSRFCARGCPACVYDGGKFVRPCKLHEEIDEYRLENAALWEFAASTAILGDTGRLQAKELVEFRKLARESGWNGEGSPVGFLRNLLAKPEP